MIVVAWVFRSSPLGNTKTPDSHRGQSTRTMKGKAVREREREVTIMIYVQMDNLPAINQLKTSSIDLRIIDNQEPGQGTDRQPETHRNAIGRDCGVLALARYVSPGIPNAPLAVSSFLAPWAGVRRNNAVRKTRVPG